MMYTPSAAAAATAKMTSKRHSVSHVAVDGGAGSGLRVSSIAGDGRATGSCGTGGWLAARATEMPMTAPMSTTSPAAMRQNIREIGRAASRERKETQGGARGLEGEHVTTCGEDRKL